MDSEEIKFREAFKSASNAKLRELQSTTVPYSQKHNVIAQMLHERDYWKQFWTSGIVAWVSLGISLLLFILHLFGH